MSTSRIAVFPGSFDPLTKGHEAIVKKAIPLFDKIVIAIGTNSSKQYHFSLEERLKHIQAVFEDINTIEVQTYTGLTVDFCKSIGANFLVRGLRDVKDFEYEKSIAIMNNKVAPQVETVFFMTDPEFSAINSVIVRDILKNGGDARQFLPQKMNNLI